MFSSTSEPSWSLPAAVMWKRMFSKTHQYGLKFRDYPEKNRGVDRADFVKEYETRLHRMAPKIFTKRNSGGPT
jgi:hypothetical protein